MMKNNETLAGCGVKKDSCINLYEILRMISICVKINKTEEIWFTVKKTTMVEKVKELLYEKIGVPPYKQLLKFGSNFLTDSDVLDHFGVTNGSQLELYKIEIIFEEEKVGLDEDEEEKGEGSEYSNLIDIMNFDGSWDEKILKVIARTETELLKNMPDQVRKLKTRAEQLRAMYTLEGMKLLKTKFKASDQELKLILKKIVDYLEKNQLENYYQLFGSSEFGVN